MTRYIVLLIAFVGLAGLVPHYFELYAERAARAPRADGAGIHPRPAAPRPAAVNGGELPAPYLGGGRRAVLHRNGQGHYGGSFTLNGQAIEGMIDTGATYVALNESTAREIGITLEPRDFTLTVETANGRTKAARAKIDSIAIGQIREEGVEAVVLPDAAMPQTLIGMNFLNRLSSYQVRDGVLDLKD